MDNPTLYKFNLEIYPIKIWIAYKTDKAFITGCFFEDDNFAELEGEHDAITFFNVKSQPDQKRYGIMVYFNETNINTIAHEVSHVVDGICHCCRLEHDSKEPNEHIAYLQGYLMEKFVTQINRFKTTEQWQHQK